MGCGGVGGGGDLGGRSMAQGRVAGLGLKVHYGSVWGWVQDAGGNVGLCMVKGSPSRRKLRGGKLGVSSYGGRVVLCSPWGIQPFLHLHLHLTHFLLSPSAPTLIIGTHKWLGTAQWALHSMVVEWR